MTPPTVRPADLADQAPLLGADARVDGAVLGVDLTGPPIDVERLARIAEESDRILIGVGEPGPGWAPLVRALALTLVPVGHDAGPELVGVPDPAAALAELHTAAGANPQAATVLAGLLRWSGTLPVPAALDAESFAYSTLLGGPEFRAWLARRGPRPEPPTVAEPVRIARAGRVLHLTLNRPERRNAYGRQLRDALVGGLDLALLDPDVEQVVIDGEGPAFCAGGDLDEFGTAPDLATAHLVRTRAGAARPVHALRDRVEVRLHGPCVGAGIEVPAFAGHVVAAPDTTVRLPEVGMGLIPGAGGTVSLPRRIGRWRTLHLALSGAPCDATTALRWGLVDAVAAQCQAGAHEP
ncbi:enoyl-CoA hydratase/isomerase family protein [Pseudonocardia sp. RS11V-5]|uniref:enoyl-CoA hydratase/isomerase family protein n=1 Tax=Pseudonocardia terrae TaxID=2905831 RepID=UPI001E2AE1FD|nr:enoyl-CoA hydratase/isomerase family protein [Pseudonocardia terrae]MCE3554885.1 enoyl-CoA hydratase/isomerase family protein [Pseudonocardia terrae]